MNKYVLDAIKIAIATVIATGMVVGGIFLGTVYPIWGIVLILSAVMVVLYAGKKLRGPREVRIVKD
jgi:hypothetical protein